MEMNEVKEMTTFLFNEKSKAHIETKDNSFYNGLIVELRETFFILDDRVLGNTPLAYSEITLVSKYREEGNVGRR